MFWHEARDRYKRVTADDEDVKKFLELSHRFQEDLYEGITGAVCDLGHRWVAARTPAGKILEIGFGSGRHSLFFSRQREDYFPSEMSPVHATSPLWSGVLGRVLRCDARTLPFGDGTFKAVISLYNLEHILELRQVFCEVHRVLDSDGRFLIALPCEGGLTWNIGRELTTRRHFQRKYGINYDKVIAFEHVRDLRGVLEELRMSRRFVVDTVRFLPLGLPSVHLNLIACLQCSKKNGG